MSAGPVRRHPSKGGRVANEILRLLALLVLLGGNAFFVIGEYSIVTARRGALRATAEAGSAGACAALRLMDDPVEVLSTVQVGITGIGILIGTTCPTLSADVRDVREKRLQYVV